MLRQLENVSQCFRFLRSLVIDSWGLWLTLMLIFAMNRYAVAWIEDEKKELMGRLEQLEKRTSRLDLKIEEASTKVKAAGDPRFQEMMIMQKLMIVPDNHEMVQWSPVKEDT